MGEGGAESGDPCIVSTMTGITVAGVGVERGADSEDPCIVSTMTGITVAEGGGEGGGQWGPVYCEHDDGDHSGGGRGQW